MCADAEYDPLADVFAQVLDCLGGGYEFDSPPNRNEPLAKIAAICAAAAKVSSEALMRIEPR